MFSGIIEARARLLQLVPRDKVVEIHLELPKGFNDLEIGHSVSVDGVCLTVERLAPESVAFVMAAETLQITNWKELNQNREFNLERSLCWGQRVHGHWVTGHVDAIGKVVELHRNGENLGIKIGHDLELAPFVWRKGSIAVNGVSLTINHASKSYFEIGLIPETLRRTNLGNLKVGDAVNLEVDNMARGLVHNLKSGHLKLMQGTEFEQRH